MTKLEIKPFDRSKATRNPENRHPRTVAAMAAIRPIIEAKYADRLKSGEPIEAQPETPITPARPYWLNTTRHYAPFAPPIVQTHFRRSPDLVSAMERGKRKAAA